MALPRIPNIQVSWCSRAEFPDSRSGNEVRTGGSPHRADQNIKSVSRQDIMAHHTLQAINEFAVNHQMQMVRR
jgi:hypothetical protein